MSLLHSLHGDMVIYSVASLQDWVEPATFNIAFASAWRTYQLVSPWSSSQTFSKPRWGTVVAVADNHLVFNDKSPYLLALAIGEFAPLSGHS